MRRLFDRAHVTTKSGGSLIQRIKISYTRCTFQMVEEEAFP
jgi:hypothetical protein